MGQASLQLSGQVHHVQIALAHKGNGLSIGAECGIFFRGIAVGQAVGLRPIQTTYVQIVLMVDQDRGAIRVHLEIRAPRIGVRCFLVEFGQTTQPLAQCIGVEEWGHLSGGCVDSVQTSLFPLQEVFTVLQPRQAGDRRAAEAGPVLGAVYGLKCNRLVCLAFLGQGTHLAVGDGRLGD